MATDTNIENTKPKAAAQEDASAKLNQDLYRWSPSGGENCGCEGEKGGKGNAPAANGNRGAERTSDCDFKPDYALSTPRARAWQAESEKRRQLPMELNRDCTYDVKWVTACGQYPSASCVVKVSTIRTPSKLSAK